MSRWVGQFGRWKLASSSLVVVVGWAAYVRSEPVYPEVETLKSHLADPCVISVGGVFFLIATGEATDGRGLPVYRSEDLSEWAFVWGAVKPGPAGAWNRRNFWTPEIHVLDGRYYVYYSDA